MAPDPSFVKQFSGAYPHTNAMPRPGEPTAEDDLKSDSEDDCVWLGPSDQPLRCYSAPPRVATPITSRTVAPATPHRQVDASAAASVQSSGHLTAMVMSSSPRASVSRCTSVSPGSATTEVAEECLTSAAAAAEGQLYYVVEEGNDCGVFHSS